MRLKRTISILVLVFSCLMLNKAWATHERAGYITYQHISAYTYYFTVVTYTRESSYLADREYLTVYWGDGKHDSLCRCGDTALMQGDVKQNEYHGYHTFPGPYTYIISMTDPNRIEGILNIDDDNSVSIPLCLIDTMNLLPPNFYGYASSPIILNPPIQYGDVLEPFYYNPNAYDPDGDSLSYSLMPPKQSTISQYQNVPLYEYPDQIAPGSNNIDSIDAVTGLFTWKSPQEQGIYNIAILITEYRKFYGKYYKIGTMDIDMEIIIEASYDRPPVISTVRDTCILAGQTLNVTVTATDPDVDQYVYLSAAGTPFEVDTPDIAHFNITFSALQEEKGLFTWSTNCNEIRYQDYSVVFTALDSYNPPLEDQITWQIKVVAPPPEELIAKATGNDVILNWLSPYTCSTAGTFIGFTVWRNTTCDSLVPDTCNPTSVLNGYTELTPKPIRAYTYTDNSVLQGIDYSYRVVAVFADSTSTGFIYNEAYSIPSNEVCVYLKKDVPVITKVSVYTTSVDSGIMHVAWSKPSKYINDSIVFDTTEYPGPYKYNFYRAVGFNGSNPIFLNSYTAPSFYLFNDTTFVDSLIDTKDNPYSYLVKFYSNNGDSLVGTTNIASSIYLTLVGNNHIVTLTWKENVPWTNDSFVVYRQNHLTKAFDSITTTKQQTYTDHGLDNDTTYCYKVKSYGHYSIPDITNPLTDTSQINCTVPVDTTRPCTPTLLTVLNDCNSQNNYGAFINQLSWTSNKAACINSSILKFYIYYATQENQPLQLIDSTQGPIDSTYTSLLNGTVAGCYAITSVDSGHTQSYKSNVICVNNCPEYNLPNVFTPNGDEHNDLFTPIPPYQYIDHIDMHIFNRWGELVFETTDPQINWNGKDFKSGKDCPDGVYYYTCDVYENTVTGVVKLNPSLKGYIHILR